jgi:hypothetical protein
MEVASASCRNGFNGQATPSADISTQRASPSYGLILRKIRQRPYKPDGGEDHHKLSVVPYYFDQFVFDSEFLIQLKSKRNLTNREKIIAAIKKKWV